MLHSEGRYQKQYFRKESSENGVGDNTYYSMAGMIFQT
jgi:hypothetical protein